MLRAMAAAHGRRFRRLSQPQAVSRRQPPSQPGQLGLAGAGGRDALAVVVASTRRGVLPEKLTCCPPAPETWQPRVEFAGATVQVAVKAPPAIPWDESSRV
jgi:hypothetical protein